MCSLCENSVRLNIYWFVHFLYVCYTLKVTLKIAVWKLSILAVTLSPTVNKGTCSLTKKQQENWTKYKAGIFRKWISSSAGLFSLKRRETNEIISMIASAFLLEIISRLQCRKGQSNQSTVVCSIRRQIRTQEGQGSSNLEDRIQRRISYAEKELQKSSWGCLGFLRNVGCTFV